MGRYDFDEIVDRRNTNSMNVEGWRNYIFGVGYDKKFPIKDEEFIRMWVADMDFAVAPEIVEAIKERADKRIFGYTKLFSNEYYNALRGWCRKRYDWDFPNEELVTSYGVIPIIYQLVEDIVGEGEKVLLLTPSYGPFKGAAVYNGVGHMESPMIIEDGEFRIDFDDLEEKAADPSVNVLIFCNPHNPTGRVWTEEELKQVGEIVEKNGLWLISDEIHCDLLRKGITHIPFGKIMPDYPRLITCMAASKAFNIAGLEHANAIIRDKEERERFLSRDKIGQNNPLSIAAHQAAYEKGEPWLEELREYLDGNFALLKEFLDEYFPECNYKIPGATYLAWVDISPYLGDVKDHTEFFAERAGVLIEGGDKLFVGNAQGYIRLNLAIPRSVLKTALDRMKEAMDAHIRI